MAGPTDRSRYTEAELLAVTIPDNVPRDFEAFWRSTRDEAMALDPRPTFRTIWSPDPQIDVYEIYYRSYGEARIGGWMTIPKDPKATLVVGHGYGGRGWLEMQYAEHGFATLFPCIRGFHLSASDSIPWRTADHVLHGIDNRDSYVLRGCVADLWLACSVITEFAAARITGNTLPLGYVGGSFCGGLGALMLPWEPRVEAAYLKHPTFGHHPIRLEVPSEGSAEAVREYSLSHPEVSEVLAYYDAASAATRISIPTLCAPALYDPKVTPKGQFAVANALQNGERFTLSVGHATGPGYEEELRKLTERVFSFFVEHLSTPAATHAEILSPTEAP